MTDQPASNARRFTRIRKRTPKPVLVVLTTLVVLCGVALSLTALLIFGFGGWIGPGSSAYSSVSSPESNWRFVEDQVDHRLEMFEAAPDFMIREGRLYLRRQTVRHGLVATSVSHGDWTIQKLREFRRRNLELEVFWPDPAALNGGVAWIPWR
jgi:hypothetical protein